LMLFCTVFALLFQSADKIATTLIGELYTLFYVANWAQVPPRPPGIGPMSHAWSLSVEEQFYIIWPLLLYVLLKLKSKAVVLLILSSLAAVSILLNVWFWQTGVPYLRMYFGSDTRANEILIGCIAALLLSWGVFQRVEGPKWTGRLKWTFHSFALISFTGILLSFFLVRHTQSFVYNGGFALISIGVAVLILDLVLFPSAISRCFEFAVLVWIGKISYGLYLWHFPIFEASRQLFEGRTSVIFYQVFGLVATFIAAAASFYLLEQPFLKLRRRFRTSRPESDLFPVSTRTAPSV
jgi:peptidoglycan/LPS O-acetylase OafA/YrhL